MFNDENFDTTKRLAYDMKHHPIHLHVPKIPTQKSNSKFDLHQLRSIFAEKTKDIKYSNPSFHNVPTHA